MNKFLTYKINYLNYMIYRILDIGGMYMEEINLRVYRKITIVI